MTAADELLALLHEGSTPDEARDALYYVGECVARRDSTVLTRFHRRAQRLREATDVGSWLHGVALATLAYLDGYFATLEPVQLIEHLQRELEGQPLWREVMRQLTARNQRLNQAQLGGQIHKRTGDVPTSKTAISHALDDLRARELVEYVDSEPDPTGETPDRRERFHVLTQRGWELCQRLSLSASTPQARPAPTPEKPARQKTRRPRPSSLSDQS